MYSPVASLLVLFCLFTIALCDQEFQFGGLRLELSNSDAEFKYKNEYDANHAKFEIKLRVKEFNEVDATGAMIVKGTIPSSGSWSIPILTTLNGVSVNKTTYTGAIQVSGKPSATFSIETYIVKGAGNVMNGVQSLSVTPNDVKFTLTVSSWPWSSATNTLNAILRLENSGGISDADDNQVKDKSGDEKEMSFGGATLGLATQVVADGKNVALLPLITTPTTGSNEIALRFPHFNSSISYDPSLKVASPASNRGIANINFNTIIPLVSILFCLLFFVF